MKITNTFSIAARCSTTGALGAIVTSSSPAVGARCPWIKSDVGVVLTQNVTDPRLADIGLTSLGKKYHAKAAMRAMIAASDYPEYRQLAVVDAQGNSSVFTGEKALGVYGEFSADNVACIGNLLSDSIIPSAMGQYFLENKELSFADRLIASLQVGFNLGGELDQERSIALLVYLPETPFAYIDLRVDDSDDPLGDLKKLWNVYKGQADDYRIRAVNPVTAPSFGVIGDE